MEERTINIDSATCPYCNENVSSIIAEYSATVSEVTGLRLTVRNRPRGDGYFVTMTGNCIESSTDVSEFSRYCCPRCGEEIESEDLLDMFGVTNSRNVTAALNTETTEPVLQTRSNLVCGDNQKNKSIELCKKCDIPVYEEDEFICTQCMKRA